MVFSPRELPCYLGRISLKVAVVTFKGVSTVLDCFPENLSRK